MFCGLLAERNDYIDLPDCDYQGMMEFLRSINTEEVRFNGDNILQLPVLYLAEKYMIPSLTLHLKELFITGGRYGISLIKSCLLAKNHEFVLVYAIMIVSIRFICA